MTLPGDASRICFASGDDTFLCLPKLELGKEGEGCGGHKQYGTPAMSWGFLLMSRGGFIAWNYSGEIYILESELIKIRRK